MSHIFVRIACFTAAVTSGTVLLAKVYGLAEMSFTVPYIVLPCCIGLVVMWWLAPRLGLEEIGVTLGIGIFGGLLSTLAYDLTRLPFHLSGYLVFATNSTYGLWVTDADTHTRYTEIVGWLYHFSNGLTFAVMYAVFMRGRHWIWAVIYAFGLETIAIYSHFGQVFSLAGNYGMISIAYLAHISYGLPIGIMMYRYELTRSWMRENRYIVATIFAIFVASFAIPLFNEEKIARDGRVVPGAFIAEGTTLNPFMRRIERGESVEIVNPDDHEISVRIVKSGVSHAIGPGQTAKLAFPEAGIHQIYINTDGRSTSSFVIAEPVAETPVRQR